MCTCNILKYCSYHSKQKDRIELVNSIKPVLDSLNFEKLQQIKDFIDKLKK